MELLLKRRHEGLPNLLLSFSRRISLASAEEPAALLARRRRLQWAKLLESTTNCQALASSCSPRFRQRWMIHNKSRTDLFGFRSWRHGRRLFGRRRLRINGHLVMVIDLQQAASD
jgi:hypothetical protein